MNITKTLKSLGVLQFKIYGNPTTESEYSDNVEVLNGFTKPSWEALTVKWIEIQPIGLAEEAREKRNQLLAATDWTANSDVTMTTEMTAYRTLLRNLPAQADFPTTINWPTAP
tara:strand:- start:118 stop:456 length:339 start_codon:yes stop_codon:yes gene_type:complete